jgi:rubrerythrin
MLGHAAIAYLVAPIRVRRDRAVAEMLGRFALAERGSYLTMRWAAERTRSAERSALYLRHAVDESRHARMFERRARELGLAVDGAEADAEDLFETLGETGFLAFVTLAEGRGRREFDGYRKALASRGDEKTASLFEAILVDETRHESYSGALLVLAVGSRFMARLWVIRIALWEAWRSLRRASAFVGSLFYAVVASLLYVVVLPVFALYVKRKRPIRAGWIERR